MIGHAAADRILGLLSGAMSEHDRAREHFQSAIEFCRNAGYRPQLARSCFDYSNLLLEHNDPSDRDKATELQDEAIAIATDLGMTPLLERVLAQRGILKA